MSKVSTQAYWFKWALINFLIAAVLGSLLRLAFVTEIPGFDYRNFLHAHSHIAILGWAFLGMYSLLCNQLNAENRTKAIYKNLFWAFQFSIIGMLISFAIYGYHPLSIGFSTLHVILSYIFVVRYIKDIRDAGWSKWPKRFILSGLFFLIFSTIALWLMPVLIISGWQNKPIYYISVQFYLHFQFNGWLIFTALGILFQYLEQLNIKLEHKKLKGFFYFLFVSCFPTFALAITWTNPLDFLFYINGLGVMIQLVALVYFLALFRNTNIWSDLKDLPYIRILLFLAVSSFAVKIIIQSAVIIPYVGTVAYTIRNFVLGFLHLLLLGMISSFLLAKALLNQWLNHEKTAVKRGISLFLAGFIATELLLFLQGCLFWGAKGFLPYYYEFLFAVTLLLPLGILMILISYSKPTQ